MWLLNLKWALLSWPSSRAVRCYRAYEWTGHRPTTMHAVWTGHTKVEAASLHTVDAEFMCESDNSAGAVCVGWRGHITLMDARLLCCTEQSTYSLFKLRVCVCVCVCVGTVYLVALNKRVVCFFNIKMKLYAVVTLFIYKVAQCVGEDVYNINRVIIQTP